MSVVLLLSRKRTVVVRAVLVTLAALILAACGTTLPTAPEVDRRPPLLRSAMAPDTTPPRDTTRVPRDSSAGSGGSQVTW